MMPTGEAPAVLPTGPEPEDVDVKQFYVPSDALDACDAPGAEAAALAERLDSDSWTLACASLLIVRRLATHHPDHLAEVLDVVLPKVRHHMNSLRSSLCKTALICAADLFRAFGDIMLEHLETGEPSMLTTLLSKAALEKRFVMDEAKRTLAAAVSYLSVEDIMRALLDRVGSKNDKVRAVVATCVADVADKALSERSENDDEPCCVDIERDELLRAAASFVNDRQPTARDSARRLLSRLRETFLETADQEGWAQHTEATLGKAEAVRILKIA